MKNIAIVEDDDQTTSLFTQYIEQFSKQKNQEFNVVRFKDAFDFIQDYKAVYAVVLMDVQMPKMNGMDGAMQLRKLDKSVSLIFISNLVQYAQKGYEVDAVSFLVKPVSYFEFSMKFQKALDIYVMNERKDITLHHSTGICRVSTDKLMYVEIANHRLYYHLIDEVIEVTGALSQVEEDLSPYGFLRCNNCYLVNPRFVVSVKGFDLTIGNTVLQISRPRRASFLSGLANFYAGNEG